MFKWKGKEEFERFYFYFGEGFYGYCRDLVECCYESYGCEFVFECFDIWI